MKEICGLRVDVEYDAVAPRPLDEADGAVQHALAILGLPTHRSRLGKRHRNFPVCGGNQGGAVITAGPSLPVFRIFMPTSNLVLKATDAKIASRLSRQSQHDQVPFAICEPA